MAGAYAVLKKARRRPKPNHGRNGGNQARRCDRQDVHDGQRKDDGGRFGKEFLRFIFLRILLVRAVLVVAFNVMTDAPALQMRRRRRSRRGGLVVGVGILSRALIMVYRVSCVRM